MSVAIARLLAVLVLFSGECALALPQNSLPEYRGEVAFQPGKLVFGYSISLYDLDTRFESTHADVDMSGSFTLRGVRPGQYMVRIRDNYGETVREEFVTFGEGQTPLRFNVRERETPRPPSGGVSVKQLQHPPSEKAVQAFLTAAKFSESGKYSLALEQLEKAVRLSPEFAQAYTNLAAQHVRSGEFELAVAEARRAMELSAPNPMDLCNLAIALWSLNRIPEAIHAAEGALALDSGFINAHFVVGSLLAMDPATREAGIHHLERAAPVMPVAAANLAKARAITPANAERPD